MVSTHPLISKHWCLSDRKSPQVSRTLLSILADLNNPVVWMVSTRLLTSKSYRSCTNPFGTIPSALITNGITITFIFHSFFNSLARSKYLSVFSLPFSFTLSSTGTIMSNIRQVLFFFFLISYLLVKLFR